MWLIEFHLCFSVLCMATFMGFKTIFRQNIIDNGWDVSDDDTPLKDWLMFFVPILNFLFVVVIFVVISIKKDDFDKYTKHK